MIEHVFLVDIIHIQETEMRDKESLFFCCCLGLDVLVDYGEDLQIPQWSKWWVKEASDNKVDLIRSLCKLFVMDPLVLYMKSREKIG